MAAHTDADTRSVHELAVAGAVSPSVSTLRRYRELYRDAPDTLHHLMGRAIERTALFRDDTDHADLGARLAALTEQAVLPVLA